MKGFEIKINEEEIIKSSSDSIVSVFIDPDDISIKGMICREYYLMGNECITKARDSQAAFCNFNKALQMNPLFVDAWIRKGVTLLDIDELYDAHVCLNEAVRLSPISFKARYKQGKCHLKLKNYEEAVTHLLKAVSIKADYAAAHDYLAEAYSGLGREEDVQSHRDIADDLRG